MLDCRSFGGQAGASARIENYLGFPTGISGMVLMARAYNQAQKFEVEMVTPDEALRHLRQRWSKMRKSRWLEVETLPVRPRRWEMVHRWLLPCTQCLRHRNVSEIWLKQIPTERPAVSSILS